MKTYKNCLKGLSIKGGGALLVMAMSSLLFSVSAQANTSAGATLRNTVSVAYKDTGGAAQTAATATVDVIVDLVPSVAWAGISIADQTIGSATELPAAYTLSLTNTGNGSDAYNLTDNTVQSCTGTASLAAEGFGPTPTPMTLGATVSSGAGVFALGNTTIPVSNMTVADFANPDVVVIGGSTFVVFSATAGAGILPDTLVVIGDASALVAAAGVQIGERKTVSYAGPAAGLSGVLTAGGVGDLCEHQHQLTATGTLAVANPQVTQATAADAFTTLVRGVTLTVTKYVRNVTAPAKTGAGSAVYATVTYYASGVTGNPGDTLEYVVLATNASSADAANVVFSDTLPLYTTYQTSTLVVDANGDEIFDAVIVGDTEVDAVAGGVIAVAGGIITVYAGVGGSEDGAGTGGSVQDVGQIAANPSNKTAIRYQVKID